MRTPPRLLLIFAAAVLVVVGAIAALATGEWWLLPVAFVILLVVSALVLFPLGKALGQGEKPDPVTDARLEEEGADSSLGLQQSDEPSESTRGEKS